MVGWKPTLPDCEADKSASQDDALCYKHRIQFLLKLSINFAYSILFDV